MSQQPMKTQIAQLNSHNPQISARLNIQASQMAPHLVSEIQGGQPHINHQPLGVPPRINFDSQQVPPHLGHQALQMTQHLNHELQRAQQRAAHHGVQMPISQQYMNFDASQALPQFNIQPTQLAQQINTDTQTNAQRLPHPAMQLTQHRNGEAPQALTHFNAPFGHLGPHVNPDVTQALAQMNLQPTQMSTHINYPGVNLQHINPDPVSAQPRLNLPGTCVQQIGGDVSQAIPRGTVQGVQVSEPTTSTLLQGPAAINRFANANVVSQPSNMPLQPNPEVTQAIAQMNLDAVQLRHLNPEATQISQLLAPTNLDSAQALPFISEVPQPMQQTDIEASQALPALTQIPPNVTNETSQVNPSMMPRVNAENVLPAPLVGQRVPSRFNSQTSRVQPQGAPLNASQLQSHISCRISSRNSSAVLGSQISPIIGPQLATSGSSVVYYAVQAIKCFVKAITLAEGPFIFHFLLEKYTSFLLFFFKALKTLRYKKSRLIDAVMAFTRLSFYCGSSFLFHLHHLVILRF